MVFSKSSMNDVPSPSTMLEVPGSNCANSALTVTVDFSFVSKNGNASTILVSMRESLRMLKSKPYWMLRAGSAPIKLRVISGRSL